MRLERIRPTVLRMTVHSYELATIIATLRWMADEPPRDVPAESLQMVHHLLADYDRELTQLNGVPTTAAAHPEPPSTDDP